MIVCIICGAISTDDETADKHYNRQHLEREEPEDELWISYDKNIAVVMKRQEIIQEVEAEIMNA